MRTKGLVLTAAALLAATSLSGCDRIKSMLGRKPAGQVIATVNGEEITALQLRAEMGGFSARDPKVMKQAQQAALQQVILRTVVAQEAKRQKLDKSPEYNLQVERGRETLLAQLYQRKVASELPVPTRKDAESFVAEHPDMFAQRKVMVVDQVIARPAKLDPEKYRPLQTLDQVKSALAGDGVQYQETVSVIDTATAPPQLTAQINKLPPGEVFVVPQNGSLVFNHIDQARAIPLQGDVAIALATNAVQSQRARDALSQRIKTLREAADGKITYNEAFKPPPKTPAAKAAPAPAAKAP